MLGALGRREQALEHIKEAVDILRKLAVARPNAYRPDLAQSLTKGPMPTAPTLPSHSPT